MTLREFIFGVDWNKLLLAQLGAEGYAKFLFVLAWRKSLVPIIQVYESDFDTFETPLSKLFNKHYKGVKHVQVYDKLWVPSGIGEEEELT